MSVESLTLFHNVWEKPWEVVDMNKEQEKPIRRLGVAPLPTNYGAFTLVAYGDNGTGQEHYALVYGDFMRGSLGNGEDVLVRVHSSCITSEVFDATNCECPEQKEKALSEIAKEGRGVFVYLHQEGRGNGVKGKMEQLANMFHFENGVIVNDMDTDSAYKKAGYEGERRDFSCAGHILDDLGVSSVRIMTNNPGKIQGLTDRGIVVNGRKSILIEPKNGVIAADLKAKHDKLGHLGEE